MRPGPIFVNLFLYANSFFPQVLFALFLYGYKVETVQALWINQVVASLFFEILKPTCAGS